MVLAVRDFPHPRWDELAGGQRRIVTTLSGGMYPYVIVHNVSAAAFSIVTMV